MTPAKSKISNIILSNPLIDNQIEGAYFYNLNVDEKELVCDALHLELSNGQNIFLDPSFLGINIGGLEVKQIWEENLVNGLVPQLTIIN